MTHAGLRIVPLTPTLAAALSMLGTLALYVLYTASTIDTDLYALSKTFASYELRRHLGMSKRYLLQYGHLVFLFALLVLSVYVVPKQPSPLALLNATRRALNRYAFPIFLFHYPLLYLYSAAIDHDPTSNASQLALFALVIVTSVALSEACYAVRPLIDRIGRMVKRAARQADAYMNTGPRSIAGELEPAHMTPGFSAAVDWAKIIATFAVVLGHFSFPEFSQLDLAGFDGSAPRFAVPLFFLTSGYLAMASLDRAQRGFVETVARRWWSYMFVVVPMLLVVPLMDWLGFSIDPAIYMTNEKFIDPVSGEGGPVDLRGFTVTAVNSVLYLNEIWIYNLFELGTPQGGVGTFSNDPFWFMCYLMPYTLLLTTAWALRGVRRVASLTALMLFVGPPVLLLAPVYFAGVLAYRMHRRWFVAAA